MVEIWTFIRLRRCSIAPLLMEVSYITELKYNRIVLLYLKIWPSHRKQNHTVQEANSRKNLQGILFLELNEKDG